MCSLHHLTTFTVLQILVIALKCFNYFFTAMFIFEAGMKISALGLGRYLHDRFGSVKILTIFA